MAEARYTKLFMDNSEYFTVMSFDVKDSKVLTYMGTKSGRDGDKFGPAKLDVEYMNNIPWVKQARLVLFCRKLYAQPFDPYCFTDEKVMNQNYKKDDFHTMYIAEIVKVMVDKR